MTYTTAIGSEEVPTSSKDDISLGDNSADSIRGDTSAMDTSEVDSSKENGWSVSLIVHTDGIQDDLDEELKAAEKAEEAAKENKEEQKRSMCMGIPSLREFTAQILLES